MIDPSWPESTQVDPSSPELTQVDPKWPKLTQIDPSWPELTRENFKKTCILLNNEKRKKGD